MQSRKMINSLRLTVSPFIKGDFNAKLIFFPPQVDSAFKEVVFDYQDNS